MKYLKNRKYREYSTVSVDSVNFTAYHISQMSVFGERIQYYKNVSG